MHVTTHIYLYPGKFLVRPSSVGLLFKGHMIQFYKSDPWEMGWEIAFFMNWEDPG